MEDSYSRQQAMQGADYHAAALACLFTSSNKLLLRKLDGDAWDVFPLLQGDNPAEAMAKELWGGDAAPLELKEIETGLFFCGMEQEAAPLNFRGAELCAFSLRQVYAMAKQGRLAPPLEDALPAIRANAIRIPYLNFADNDYIYRFRAEKQRNKQVYHLDDSSVALYHSPLCDAIKAVKRARERSATDPAYLDFGVTRYWLPSHFGFCLGVQNAIERAYETIAENPGKRVFMLSELIHNPFVNEDLRARGLRYLQSDKGVPLIDKVTGQAYWDGLTDQDIVIIPAFGARDEDKLKLIERGLPLNAYDATCMLVEKVWKAARRYGEQGYTVIIHGKAEHEETKATFSNSSKYAPSLIVRDLKEAELLAQIIEADSLEEKQQHFAFFADRCSPGFDLSKDLDRLAVVNQTTLLRNETLKIIDLLESCLASKYAPSEVESHFAMSSKGDTLCYATQVNQDALAKALEKDVDAAIVVGGKNSSNTFQLFRLCQREYGERAFYIQSEANILSRDAIEHFIFPYNPGDPKQGRMEQRPFLPEMDQLNILITGGASCPDGILQRILVRINSFFPAASLRTVAQVMADVESV